MAIYHFSAQTISRSQGRSSVAAAAYRAGEELYDARLDKTHDFTKKNDVLEKEILLPDGAPVWMKDREQLWNAVEQKENRKDAQSAREINIALPKELNQKQNWELAREFVKQEFVDKGMVADLTVHAGGTEQEPQPHAHIMLTMREVTEEGFGQKVRSWNDKELLKSWREHWGEKCNLELARHGFDVQIDHRSLEAQGINLEPQSKIGAKSAQFKMVRMAEHQELAERNGERLKTNPEIALDAITRQQSTFTHHDLARFVNRHTKDEAQFTEVYEAIKSSPEIAYLGTDDANRDRYTTRTMLGLETNMMKNANSLHNQKQHHVCSLNRDIIALDKNLSAEQRAAYEHIVESNGIACVIGYAGTGKSYMLGVARETWEAYGFKVQGATLSGIAAENLESGSNITSNTVANRLWHWERGNERLTNKDILVIDEAGMLGSRQMAAILNEVTQARAKVVLVLDPEQLQAIEAGAAGRAIAQDVGYVMLTDIRRQIEPWQKDATKDFAENRTKEGLLAYEEHYNIHAFETRASAIASMVEQWDETRSQSPEKSQIMLAYTRDEVKGLNDYARSLCRKHGELGEDHGFKTTRGIRDFATGDRVYFLRNENHTLHVKNGTLGTIQELDGRNFMIKLDRENSKGQDTVKFNFNDYRDLEYGYAATIHKAQGITVDRTYVLASKYFDRHTTYVAMSRHRDGADLYYSKDEFPSFNALSRTLGREHTKDVTLDYMRVRNLEAIETKILQINHQEHDKPYSAILTKDREFLAEQRSEWRLEKLARGRNLADLENITGLKLNTKLKEGERGILQGNVFVGDHKFAVVGQKDGHGLLISTDQLGLTRQNQELVIEKRIDPRGYEVLRGVNPELQKEYDDKQQRLEFARQESLAKEKLRQEQQQEKTQQRQLEREIDRGGFER